MKRKPPQKVLTFRAASIGDGLLARYFLENIHRAYPDAKCYLVVSTRGEMVRSLLKHDPWITVLEVNRKKPFSLLRAVIALWGTDITLTQGVTAGGTFSTATKLFARFVTRKGGLFGFSDAWKHNNTLYDTLIDTDPKQAVFLHETDALQAIGVPIAVLKPRYELPDDESVLEKFSLKKQRYIVLHLFSGSDTRGLSEKRRDALVKALSDHIKNKAPLILTGGPGEAEELRSLGEKYGAVNTAGATSAEELAYLIKYAGYVVSLDTGAAHLASYMNVPLTVLRCYQTAHWWQKEQHGERVTVLTAPPGEGETDVRDKPFPQSLNGITDAEISDTLSL